MTGPTKRVRRDVLLRDLLQCVACGRTVAVEDGNDLRIIAAYSLQHRVARGSGGRSPLINEPVNLIVACGSATSPEGCHNRMESNPDWARSRGYRVDSWDSPETVPVVVRVAPGVDEVYLLDGAARIRQYPVLGGAR